jgi:hypothetical protein
MKAMVLGVVGLAASVAAAVPAAQQATASAKGGTAWLHVRVDEVKGSKVSVNLPLTVVEAALQAAPETIVSHGRVRLGNGKHDLSIADLRKVWQELKAVGDAELVSVEDEEDGKVTVSRLGDLVQVRVDGDRKGEKVHVDLPVEVVDALLSGQGEQLDLKAGMAALRGRRGDIVRVNDQDSTVRVWIDEGK